MELTAPLPLTVTARLEPTGVWLYGFLVVALVAGHTGGFEPTTWGWCALVTFWLAAIGLLVRDRIELCRSDLMFIGGLLAFTVWVALSSLWSSSVTSTMHEVQRDLAYVGVVTAGLVLVRRRTTHALLGGVLSAIVLLSALRAGDAGAARSLRRLRLRGVRLPPRGADHVLERPRDLHGDRDPACGRLRPARTLARCTRAGRGGASPPRRDHVLHLQPRCVGCARRRARDCRRCSIHADCSFSPGCCCWRRSRPRRCGRRRAERD